MYIQIKPYPKANLHSNLDSLQEMILVYIEDLQKYEPVSISKLSDVFNLSQQYANKRIKELIALGYVRKHRNFVEVLTDKINPVLIPNEFLFDSDFKQEHKACIIDLYRMCINLDYITLSIDNCPGAYSITLKALEYITDEGYALVAERLNFDRIFQLKSRYDY